jgi:hypothetical protein
VKGGFNSEAGERRLTPETVSQEGSEMQPNQGQAERAEGRCPSAKEK